MQVKVFVTPRKGILDPQGRAVEQSLKSLGFKGASSVKIGKYIVFDVDAATAGAARAEVRRMCEQLLANPLIEDYTFEVEGE
ncbi:MAG TPA: phosphoribosylformylglycinamidine synthase subunit PurS [Candidatus Binataceae bacterium]|nr:phosphoribosylformylglycinamidine synthase subunit PurS [Candidatus Binataceae bacterium]